MNSQAYLEKIRKLIASDDLESALQELSLLLQNTPKLDEAIYQTGRYNNLRKQIRLGTISYSEANLSQNQIRIGLLDLLGEIESNCKIPTLHAEIERGMAIVFSKKVAVNASITAGRDVHIGDTVQTESKTSRKLKVFLYAFVPILAIGLAYFYMQYQELQKPLNLTVVVSDETPNPNIPFSKAKISLTYGDKTETQTTDNEAIFKGIPPIFKGENVILNVEADGFLTNRKSLKLSSNMITVPLSRDNSLSLLSGIIMDENTQPVTEAQVRVQDISVLSNSSGVFALSIPFEKQRKAQRVKVIKQGFKIWDFETNVIKGENLNIILKK